MVAEAGLTEAALLFRLLGNDSRLHLVRLLASGPMTVGALADAAEMSQPLTSQHLRTLRLAGLIDANRTGREVTYCLRDDHVRHVVADAISHALETSTQPAAITDQSTEEYPS